MLNLFVLLSLPYMVMSAAVFGETKFSHMTAEEFSKSHGLKTRMGYYRTYTPHTFTDEEVKDATETPIDWRDKGVVTPIKNQGDCGSCWVFSAIATIESQLAIKTSGLESLSEEEPLDCVTKDEGCLGGWPDDVFDWVQKNGVTVESLYNYTAGRTATPGKCRMNSTYPITKINKHIDLPNDEGQILAYMAKNGPISITVDATSFQSYKSGILDNCISNRVDHAINIVGYQPAGNDYPAYWVIRNSWGYGPGGWGENGYIRVKYGDNQCLITSGPSAAIL